MVQTSRLLMSLAPMGKWSEKISVKTASLKLLIQFEPNFAGIVFEWSPWSHRIPSKMVAVYNNQYPFTNEVEVNFWQKIVFSVVSNLFC